jgi:hypothetical protein
MLAFQAVKSTCVNQIIAVAAAMFIRAPDFVLKKGESFEICSDYMEIEFEPCAELPTEKSSKSDYHELLQKLFQVKMMCV